MTFLTFAAENAEEVTSWPQAIVYIALIAAVAAVLIVILKD